MEPHIQKAITGHHDPDISYNTYGKAFTPTQMLDEIIKVQYPEIEAFFTSQLSK